MSDRHDSICDKRMHLSIPQIIVSIVLSVAFFAITVQWIFGGRGRKKEGFYIGKGLYMTGTTKEWILLLLAPLMILSVMSAILFMLHSAGFAF